MKTLIYWIFIVVQLGLGVFNLGAFLFHNGDITPVQVCNLIIGIWALESASRDLDEVLEA